MIAATVDNQLSDYTRVSYRDAAVALWGEAGAYAHDTYTRLRPLLPELPPELPITIGIVAYGRCRGMTRTTWEHGPRISLFSSLFRAEYGQDRRGGGNEVADTILHEMVHAWLAITGRDSTHSGDWYETCNRLSLPVLGRELGFKYEPKKIRRKSVRVPNPRYDPDDPDGDQRKTIVRKVPTEEAVIHSEMCTWPHPFRPADYPPGPPIDCPTY